MISRPDLILYACIAKGTTILADFTSPNYGAHNDLQTLAYQCLRHTPPYHSKFSHTFQHKTYTFLIENADFQAPFVYFAIFEEDVDCNLDGIRFLSHLREGFNEFVSRNGVNCGTDLSLRCFQEEVHGFIKGLLGLAEDQGERISHVSREIYEPTSPPMEKAIGGLKKKKRSNGEDMDLGARERKVDVLDESSGREPPVTVLNKNYGLLGDGGKLKAKRLWRKHVWVVLLIDICICSTLFGVWLWICKGFKCLNA